VFFFVSRGESATNKDRRANAPLAIKTACEKKTAKNVSFGTNHVCTGIENLGKESCSRRGTIRGCSSSVGETVDTEHVLAAVTDVLSPSRRAVSDAFVARRHSEVERLQQESSGNCETSRRYSSSQIHLVVTDGENVG